VTGIEDKLICLCLNKNWQPIGVKTVRDAICEMFNPNCLSLNILYKKNEDDSFDFSEIETVEALTWKEWINLPVRSFDLSISTCKMNIRVPSVIVSSKYSEMPKKTFKLTLKNIWLRDNGICQYTGKKVDKDTGNVDHIISKARGGANSWQNMVLCHKDVNSKKGSKTPEEAGLKLIRQPKELPPMPYSQAIETVKHVDWNFFIKK
jgi:5-methylcytosine-specific restriction endonuclease McrA